MCEEIDWDWVEDAVKNIFNIWVDGSELGWAKEVWEHFGKAGLNQAPGLVEQTKIYLRLVTLGRIYHEFCGCGWDENPDWPIDFFVEHLDVDPLALGILAAKAACDYEDFDDESDLREIALITVSDEMRHEIYEFLKKTYGGDMKLYSSMWRTCRPAQREKGDDDDVDDEDREEDDEEDYDEFAVTGNNMSALNYVQQGFCC